MLKSLELHGFKSFADRTRFDFSPGITAVVGPNGSGKSNVVDGIKWILGDQSPRSLRGKEMTDVIFNGAAGRKASALAEATLTFDNSGGFLPIEAREVQIGRRLWRSGDSEYLINRTPARLRDIRDLFMGTGAGSAAYCIIEQGRVDQILQANAVSRRQIFEEAAGISRYKARKVDAFRKLERVEQNLLRLKDLVGEVETRLISLRSQAAKATSWRELSDELRELWLGVAADDYRQISRDLAEIDRARQVCEAQLDECTSRQQELESQLAALDAEVAAVDDRLRDAERQIASTRETVASHEATIRHQTARQRELEAELARLRRQRMVMQARARDGLHELAASREQLERAEQEFAGRRAELQKSEADLDELTAAVAIERGALDQRRVLLMEQMRAVSGTEGRVEALRSRRQAIDQAAQAARTRCDELDARLALRQIELQQRLSARDEAARQLAAATADLRRSQEQRTALAAAQRDQQQALAQQRERRSAEQARLAVLEDWERRQEGLAIGVQEILRRAGEHNHPPWSRIRGCVADLLEVNLDHAALVEVALGSRAQLVVIEEFDSLLDYVTSESCRISGRVGFVSADCTDEQPGCAEAAGLLSRDLSRTGGVLGRADRFARSPQELPHLAERLLADTWIVETLDVAFSLAAGPGRGCRFVTRQGELLEADGTLMVGTLRHETALVSRRSELRQFKNDLQQLGRRIADQERQLAQLGESLGQADQDVQAAEQAVAAATEHHARCRSEVADQKQQIELLRREHATLAAELARLRAEDERLAGEMQRAEEELAQAQADLARLQSELETAASEIADQECRSNQIQQRITADRVEMSRHEERVTALRTAHERLEHEQQQRTLQRDEADRRFETARARQREITLHVLNTSALLAELALEEEQSVARAEELLETKTRVRGRRADLLREETALRQRRRELSDRQHHEEIRQRDLSHQLKVLTQRIEEEYQIPLVEVVAGGASAIRAYLAERQLDDVEDSEVRSQESEAGIQPPEDGEQRTTDRGQRTPAQLSTFNSQLDDARCAEVRAELEERVNRLRRKLKAMGSVNTDSLHDLDDLEERYARQHAQLQDLVEAKAALEDIVRRINAESKRLFLETFEAVRGHFQHLFRKAFGGGDGDLVLEDPNDVLECGIEIVARPPGKELKSLSLMSGGEKALTAFALLLALFKTRPSPYCLLDEVDAPLDEANVGRLGALLEEFKGSTQFIVITHKKPTMTIADVLYGVTMEESGVSKRMSVRFEDVSDNGEFKNGASAAA